MFAYNKLFILFRINFTGYEGFNPLNPGLYLCNIIRQRELKEKCKTFNPFNVVYHYFKIVYFFLFMELKGDG